MGPRQNHQVMGNRRGTEAGRRSGRQRRKCRNFALLGFLTIFFSPFWTQFQIFRTDGHLQMKSKSTHLVRRLMTDNRRLSQSHSRRVITTLIGYASTGKPLFCINRINPDPSCCSVDLHESLKRLATDPSRPGEPATIRVASKVLSCDCESGVVTLENGEIIQGDLIVGADGM